MSADLELLRVAVQPEGAFGVLLQDGLPTGLVTVERTYPVAPSVSRGPQYVKIPAGTYRCEATTFIRGGYPTWEVTGVIGHSRLLFHRANSEADVEGCIGVGSRFGWLRGFPAVLESAAGFAEFRRLLADKPVWT